jgi:predicted ATPase/class 3 adenylate cyclase/Tfp pilus assembly protein PilF
MNEHPAILHTDIVDSLRIGEELGDVAGSALWLEHDRLARDLMRRWRGREIDKSDGFLLLFAAVDDAVAFALDYHRSLSGLSRALAARAGIHVGPILIRENPAEDVAQGAKPIEIDGTNKPLTARVSSLAAGGRTLLTDAAKSALGDCQHVVHSHGHWQIKGLDAPLELFEIGDESTPFEPPVDSDKAYGVVRTGETWLPRRAIANTLPSERDSFVGRGSTLRTLRSRFDSGARLVTILGPGGIGKTRLAVRFGWSNLGDFPGGVWFCDLTAATTLDGIAHAVAAGLRLPLAGGDPLRQIGRAIAGRGRCLVVLDNFEQVTRFAEDTVGLWLQSAAEPCFVASSRSVLGIKGEDVFVLSSLGVEDSMALLAHRGKAVCSTFRIHPSSMPVARRLVAMLDGLPLAIELAASRTNVMSLEDIAGRMKERFRLLASVSVGETRHSTLHRTLEWSWELLSRSEQSALSQLSVFEGGFTLAAFEAVFGIDVGNGAPWPVDILQALVSKSLVRALESNRFDMSFSIRDFAAEKLLAAGATTSSKERVEERHATYFAAFDQSAARRAATSEMDNLVIACRWSIAGRRADLVAPLLKGCWEALKLVGPFGAALRLAELARETFADDVHLSAISTQIAGSALQLTGNMPRAEERLRSALELAVKCGDRRVEITARCALGECRLAQGRHAEAQADLEQSCRDAELLGDSHLLLFCLNSYASCYHARGDLQKARQRYEAAYALACDVGDTRWQGGILGNLANIDHGQGNGERAVEAYANALALSLAEHDYRWAANTRCNLGLLQHELGRSAEGRDMLTIALSELKTMGNEQGAAIVHCNLGIVLDALADPNAALAHFKECAAIAAKLSDASLLVAANSYLAVQHSRIGNAELARQLIELARLGASVRDEPANTALVSAHLAEIAFRSRDSSGGQHLLDAERLAMSSGVADLYEVSAALRSARAVRPS